MPGPSAAAPPVPPRPLGCARSSPTSSNASSSTRRPARPHRSSPACTIAPSRSAAPRCERFAVAPRRARRRPARRRRGADQVDRRQAAAPAVGAPPSRRRHAPGRAQRRRGQRPVRPRLALTSDRGASLRLATRGSPQARTQAQLVADAITAATGRADRAGPRRDDRRPQPGRAAAHDRRPGRVRQGGPAGGARRARRCRGALGQGPPERDAGRSAPRRLLRTARCGRRADRPHARRARRRCDRGDRLGPPPGPARRRPARPRVRRAARQHRPPPRAGPTGRSDRDGGRGARSARPDRPHRRAARPDRLRPGRRPGLRRRRVPRRRRVDGGRARRRRRSADPLRRSTERAFLAELGAGCTLPLGAHCAGGELHAFLAARRRTRRDGGLPGDGRRARRCR